MVPSSYDPCLLIGTKEFAIVGMQTDDTLILGTKEFSEMEEAELAKAQLKAKPIEFLTPDHPLIFNGTKISQDGNDILITSKGQNEKIKLVDTSLADFKTEYKVERARGAYQATICQPKVAFGLSVAAQHQENPTVKHAEALNKCLEWQIGNKQRGLRMKPINMETAKLYVWVDGSFANLEGGASQIGYFVTIGNEEPAGENEFKFRGNAVDWSSTKCHRVARATLASELFAMVNGVDIGIALSTTLAMITKELGLPDIPVVILTDSRSLYECIVKLGTTKEKRLMIDVMAIREAYEKEEVLEIRWINGADNIGDAFTKENPNKALDTFLDTNEIVVRLEGWVKRS